MVLTIASSQEMTDVMWYASTDTRAGGSAGLSTR